MEDYEYLKAQLLFKLYRKGIWGGRHTPIKNLFHLMDNASIKDSEKAIKELNNLGWIQIKISTGEKHISLNSYKNKVHFSLAKNFNIDLVKFYKSINKYKLNAATGILSSEDFPKLVAKDLKIKDSKMFAQRWNMLLEKYLVIDKKIEKIIKILKKDYTIGTLTNVTKITNKVRRKKDMYKHFKIKLISCEIGLKKPDLKVYKLLIKKLNLSPKEIIFIDDNKKPLLAAEKFGINTILFKNHSQLVKDMRKFGVEI